MIAETDPLLEEIVELADALYIPEEPHEEAPSRSEWEEAVDVAVKNPSVYAIVESPHGLVVIHRCQQEIWRGDDLVPCGKTITDLASVAAAFGLSDYCTGCC